MISKLDQYIGDVSFSDVIESAEPWSIHEDFPEIEPKKTTASGNPDNSVINGLENLNLTVPEDISFRNEAPATPSRGRKKTRGRADENGKKSPPEHSRTPEFPVYDMYGRPTKWKWWRLQECDTNVTRSGGVKKEKADSAETLADVKRKDVEDASFDYTVDYDEDDDLDDDEKDYGGPDFELYKELFAIGEKLVLGGLKAERKELRQRLGRLLAKKGQMARDRRNVKLSLAPFHTWANEVDDYEYSKWRDDSEL
ncbi:hypothetical protein CJU90_5729 [Yarrowia sp. C11]|nr:hypothetical protein CJU90_5729 [Yarrowia sp. C11]KAG5364311.1 hypothetical protein CKK34_3107 [Yarrowia sp. E02]